MGDNGKLAVFCTLCCSLIGILGLMLFAAAFIVAKRPQSNFECYNQWAVAVDAKECGPVARKIISLGGNIADVAVASLLCMGVVWPHVMGIGGGFLAVHYNQSGKKSGVLISREAAPSNIPDVIPTDGLGAAAVAVPGAVSGYSELHTKLAGKLQWKELFDPAIDLALSGFPVSSVLGRALSEASQMIQDRPDMREVFWRKDFNRVFKEGEKLLQEGLAAILIELANQGSDYFYTGNLAKAIVAKVGPDVINGDDLKSYKAEWKPSLTAPLGGGDLQLHTAPPPGSGAIVARALQIIKGYDPKAPRSVTRHRLVEALKHALAQLPELGDTPAMDAVLKNLTNADHAKTIQKLISDTGPLKSASEYGLRHSFMEDGDAATLSVWAPDGDVLVVTSTINRHFGSMVMVDKGLLLNNAMHAFSVNGTKNALGLEPSAANLPLPGKMPMSSMAPSIVTNEKGRAITAIGGGGGSASISTLLSAVSLTGDKNIIGAKFLASEVNSVRFHPKLIPYEVEIEPEKDTAKRSPKIKDVLEARGHKVVFKVREETHISGIQLDEKTNRRCAFADHRVDGAVNGTYKKGK